MRFADLSFVGFRGDTYRAQYHADGYTVSVLYGGEARGNVSHPYEVSSWYEGMMSVEDPLCYLTETDVEYFINHECFKDYSTFKRVKQICT